MDVLTTSDQIKRVPTDKFCLDDLKYAYHKDGDAAMISIAAAMEKGLTELLSDSTERPVKSIEMNWINIPHMTENPCGLIGFFQLIGKR